VVVDTACLDNSCLIDGVKPKSKESGTQGKFVPTCHYCEKIGHIRPNCYLLLTGLGISMLLLKREIL
jgi:hypothetical protein